MSNEWNIDYMRKIAGLPLVESVEDDDEDPDVKIAMSDKRQSQFEKRNKGELSAAQKAAAEKEKAAKEKKAADKKETPKAKDKPAEKKEESKPVEKKEEAKAEDKPAEKKEEPASNTRGRKPSDSSKMGQARAWIHSHPEAKRGEFLTHAESFGMSKHYANAFFYTVKKKMKVTECFILVHPNLKSFVLAENRELNQMQWVDTTSPLEPMIFETKAEAEKIAKYMSEWKSQFADIETIKLVD